MTIIFLKNHYAEIYDLMFIRSVTSIMVLSTVSLLRVKVPVLSLHRTSIPAISSIAVILLVMAPCRVGEPQEILKSYSTSGYKIRHQKIVPAYLLGQAM